MAAQAEKVVGLRGVSAVQSTENGSGMDNTNDFDSGGHYSLASFHILKMLEAAANRRSVNIVLVGEKTESDYAKEAQKKDMENVSLV